MPDSAPLFFDTKLGGLPSPEFMQQIVIYYPNTGGFIWKARPVEMFSPSSGAQPKSAMWSASKWNTRYAGKAAFTKRHSAGYLCGSVFGKDLLAHRVAWAVCYGAWPDSHIDHINGVKTDNRIENLRDVSHAINMKNMKLHKSSTTGVMGVHWSKTMSKWAAEIIHDGKKHRLGFFDKFDDAVAARRQKQTDLGFHENHGAAR